VIIGSQLMIYQNYIIFCSVRFHFNQELWAQATIILAKPRSEAELKIEFNRLRVIRSVIADKLNLS
jgi:hypothetical protein